MILSAAWREGGLETEGRRRNPVGVDVSTARSSQGGSFLATLGFETQSRWDWKKGRARQGATPDERRRWNRRSGCLTDYGGLAGGVEKVRACQRTVGSEDVSIDHIYARPHPGPLPRGEGETLSRLQKAQHPLTQSSGRRSLASCRFFLRFGFSLRRLLRKKSSSYHLN
jgi:hypothetical protein